MGFLDQISKTLSQGVDRAKFEADKFQKTTRLQGEVNEFRRQVDAKLMELGQRAYDLQRAGQISAPSIGELSAAIDQIRSSLLSKEEELKVAQNEAFVEPSGGVSPPIPSSQVPIDYSAPPGTPAPSAPAPAGQKLCVSCGFQMPATAMFCPSCGTRSA